MKRWGFKGLRASHGVSISHRSSGSTGAHQVSTPISGGNSSLDITFNRILDVSGLVRKWLVVWVVAG